MKKNREINRILNTALCIALTTAVMSSIVACKGSRSNQKTEGANLTTPIALPAITGYPIVDTYQMKFYDNESEISKPKEGDPFYGQDANYSGNQPSYTDNADGTITDNVTGLMWQKSPDTNGDGRLDAKDKKTYKQAVEGAANFRLNGYTDWRLPTIKEQYSLIVFSGVDPSGYVGTTTDGLIPFVDTKYFDFGYGREEDHERIIDSQYASSSLYVDKSMKGNELLFGVNFADGRIKGYGLKMPFGPKEDKTFFVTYVRGNKTYGQNDFQDNKDGTISDKATGLMWMQMDNQKGVNWQEALSYAENTQFAGHSDWRLPNAKELQSLVDYSRSPSTTNSAAIDPLFSCTKITNEAGKSDFPFYWTGTTHSNWTEKAGNAAAYLSFGRALGNMDRGWVDVHGAGSQRSDPKSGNPEDFKNGRGPQGDAIRIFNYVRLVRNI